MIQFITIYCFQIFLIIINNLIIFDKGISFKFIFKYIKQYFMGNVKSQSPLQILNNFNPVDWKVTSNKKYCEIITNIKTSQQAQQYTLKLQLNQNLQHQYYIYQSRRNKNNIVEVYNVQKIKQQFSCSGAIVLKIRLQRIPYRLSDIQNLNQQQALYILKSTLIGFKTIQQMVGSVRVNQNMIGFNTKGIVKIWLNENFEKNRPQQGFNLKLFQEQVSIAKKNQQNMVKQIFKEVEEHIIGFKYPNKFVKKFKEQKVINFFESINFIDDYCEEQNIQLPKSIQFSPYHLKKQTQPEIFNQSINNTTANNTYQTSNKIKINANSVYIGHPQPIQFSQNHSLYNYEHNFQNNQQVQNKTLNTLMLSIQNNRQNNLRGQKITTVRKLMTERSLNKEISTIPSQEKRQYRIISNKNNFVQYKQINNLKSNDLIQGIPESVSLKFQKHSANSNSIQSQEPKSNQIQIYKDSQKIYVNPFLIQNNNNRELCNKNLIGTTINKYINSNQIHQIPQNNNYKLEVKTGQSFQKIKKNNQELQRNYLAYSKNQDYSKTSAGLKGINLQSKISNKINENICNLPIKFNIQNGNENKKVPEQKNNIFRGQVVYK